MTTTRGSFKKFLDELRAFESGIDPQHADRYRELYNDPAAIKAVVVETNANGDPIPGHVKRDENGNFITKDMSYKEYFATLGVGWLYGPDLKGRELADALRQMQYHSMNFLGFVGYQLGESILISTGYYLPPRKDGRSVYYQGGAPDSSFAHGADEVPYELSPQTTVLATSYNRWQGTFTGKHYVTSLAELQQEDSQEYAIRDTMAYNLATLVDALAAKKWTLAQALAKPQMKGSTKVEVSLSGFLAAAHLLGAQGLAESITTGNWAKDELGTSGLDYVAMFSGYQTIFDSPGEDEIVGTDGINEVLTAGWVQEVNGTPRIGTDKVTPGDGENQIVIHRSPESTVEIHNFKLQKDLLVLRDDYGTSLRVAGKPANIKVEHHDKDTWLVFGADPVQRVILVDHNVPEAGLDRVVKVQIVTTLKDWWRASPIHLEGFVPSLDILRGTAGMAFKHIHLSQKTDTYAGRLLPVTVLSLEQSSGGPVAVLELIGVERNELREHNFEHFDGSIQDLHRD